MPSNAPVVSGTPGTPEASTPPVVEGTPTARPKRSPTPEPTPTPSPLPDPGVEFEVPSNGYAIDVASFNCTAGSGKYDSTLQRVEINDNDPSGGSQGNWELPAEISSNIKDGDLVTFRVQGYNYGDSGFRFWIGNPNSGGCTPVMLVDQVAEGLGIDPELGYPCVKDDAGNVLEGKKGEDIQSSPQLNQMAINADPETHAFDVTFTFKAATSQNDTNSTYSHFVVKHIMSGGTAGYINGLAIKNIYYITDEEIPPTPTMDPDQKGIDLSGTKAVYGDGSVSYDEASGSVKGTSVQGLLIPLEETLAEGESRKVTVYGEATGKVRLWLSDNETHRLSDIVDPMTWATTYTLTATATGDGGTASNAIQIKVPYSDPATHVDITVTKVVVESVGDEPTPSKAPEATPSVKPDPTPSKEPEPTPSEEVTPSEAPTVYEVDLSVEKPYKQKDDSVTVEYSEGALNVTIPQFTGISFEVPADMVCKYAEVTYTSDSDIQTTMFDGDYAGSCDRGKPGEHDSGNPTLSKADVENTVKLEVREDFKGNCLKAIKIAHIDFGNSAPKSIKIKSIKFFSDNAEIGPTPSEGPKAVDLDLKGAKVANGIDGVTITPNVDGSVTATKDSFPGLVFDLPETMSEGDEITVHVESESAGSTARVYLVNESNDKDLGTVQLFAQENVVNGTIIAKGAVNQIYVKAKAYNESFTSLTIKKITVTIKHHEVSFGEGDLKLYTATKGAGNGYYDPQTGKLIIDDESAQSEIYLELIEKINKGEKATIIVKGTYNGTKGFRMWIGNGSNNSSDGPKEFIHETLPQGAFEETFTLTANAECDKLTIKAFSGSSINGLTIDSINVKVEKVEPTPTPTTDPSQPEWDGSVKLSSDNVAINIDNNKASYNEDGSVDFELSGEMGGLGTGFYLMTDKSAVDLSKYSKVVIEYVAEADCNLSISLRDEVTGSYWTDSQGNGAQIEYTTFSASVSTHELKITGSSAKAILIKNQGSETAKIKIKSIKLVK